MEERNSSNQVFENSERDFHLSDDMFEDARKTTVKQYGRDVLLQLRLHPLSLQKPRNISDMEVTKEKLYLHDINETCSTSADRYLNNNHASLKPEYCKVKHEYSLLPHYLNRLYPYCFGFHGYNGPFQNTSSKFRSSYHTYCSPLKKHCVINHQCYKDFSPEECIWAKRCFPSTEEIWNCYPNLMKKKEQLETIPKSKKKLPIIDPVTGKNVLETVSATDEEEQDTYLVQENSESSECYSIYKQGKCTGDYFCNTEINGHHLETSNEICVDSSTCSCESKTSCDNQKELNIPLDCNLCQKFEDNPKFHEGLYDDKPTLILNNKKESSVTIKDQTTSTADSIAIQESIHGLAKNTESTDENCDISKIANKNVPRICQKENHIDRHANCPALQRKDGYIGKESFRQKDKPTFRQEQQKMAILKSFLRYKKYQLEENERNLDDKRIEIANWERNLYNKAKKLHEKELWLENQSEILFNKAQQLADKEKMLNKEEENSSGDSLFSKIMFNEIEFPEKKFPSYNYSDVTWDEIPNKIKSTCKNVETCTNDYSYFEECTSNSSKVTEHVVSNIEKCKSDTKSLEDLERNVIFIEKMHSSAEIGDASLENKTEMAPSNVLQKKSEIDPLGYSKGRRYLPEHIKYWLNKRDKNSS